MARNSISPEIAEQLRDTLVIEASPLVMNEADAARSLKLNGVLQVYLKARLQLLQYVAERKSN